jgi:hypothetical protein
LHAGASPPTLEEDVISIGPLEEDVISIGPLEEDVIPIGPPPTPEAMEPPEPLVPVPTATDVPLTAHHPPTPTDATVPPMPPAPTVTLAAFVVMTGLPPTPTADTATALPPPTPAEEVTEAPIPVALEECSPKTPSPICGAHPSATVTPPIAAHAPRNARIDESKIERFI